MNEKQRISKAHSRILRKRGNPEYSPTAREIEDEIINMLLEESAMQILKYNAALFEEHPFDSMYFKDKNAILKCMIDFHKAQAMLSEEMTDKLVVEALRKIKFETDGLLAELDTGIIYNEIQNINDIAFKVITNKKGDSDG